MNVPLWNNTTTKSIRKIYNYIDNILTNNNGFGVVGTSKHSDHATKAVQTFYINM